MKINKIFPHVKRVLTVVVRASTMGSPKADTTMPVVKKQASSLQALLEESVSSLRRLDMKVGMGLSTQKIRTNSGQYTLQKQVCNSYGRGTFYDIFWHEFSARQIKMKRCKFNENKKKIMTEINIHKYLISYQIRKNAKF